jgi:NhaP-type Na+/H+ or K+/H+ antiporter
MVAHQGEMPVGQDLFVVAVVVFGFGLISARIDGSLISPPMVYVAAGIILGPSALGLLDVGLGQEGVRLLAEATLVVVLFSDASRIDLRVLRREYDLPARLLGLGLPLTIAAGGALALVLFGGLEFWEAMLLGAILAPTDAALGEVVVTSPAVPLRIRQALNVESGLNDGIALPVITLFLALAAVEEDLESTSFWVAFVARQVGFGVLFGVGTGLAGAWLINRAVAADRIDGLYRQLATLAVAVAAFGGAEMVEGNGFIAAFTAGLCLGTIVRGPCKDIIDFSEDEGQLLALLTFLVFGATIAGPALDELTWEIAAYAVLSLTAVRMVPVALSLIGMHMRTDTIAFIGWFGPRGLASILFGLLVLEEADLANGPQIYLIVTWTVLLSVFAHGVTASPLSNRYGARLHADRLRAEETAEAMMEDEPVTDLPTRHG